MPIYVYECPNKHRWEEIRTQTSEEIPRCESCGGEGKKVPSAFGVVFKGPGWTPKFHER